MKFLYTGLFLLVFLFLGCYLPPNINAPSQTQASRQPVIGQPLLIPSASDSRQTQASRQPVIGQPFTGGVQPDYSQPSRNDNGVNDNYPDSSRRGSGCEYERPSHRCHELCREMYSRDRDECLEEEPNTIEDIYQVYQDIEGARNLQSINLGHFEAYLDVSSFSLVSLIRDYSRSDAEDMLLWIAEDQAVAELISDEDDDFRILNDLLSLIVHFDSDKLEVPFTRRIDKRDTLMDYALKSGNEEALDYFLEYIFMGDQACRSDNFTVDCLTVICEIGRGSEERDRGYYFDSLVFEDFMAEIIDKKVNGSASSNKNKWIKGSGDDKIDNISDLNYTWAGTEWNPSDGELPVCGDL